MGGSSILSLGGVMSYPLPIMFMRACSLLVRFTSLLLPRTFSAGAVDRSERHPIPKLLLLWWTSCGHPTSLDHVLKSDVSWCLCFYFVLCVFPLVLYRLFCKTVLCVRFSSSVVVSNSLYVVFQFAVIGFLIF